MKLLFVVSTLGTGGAQKVAAELSIALSKYYDIDFLLNDDKDIAFKHSGHILDLGLKENKEKLGFIYQMIVFVRRITRIRELTKNNEYKAVISFLDSANYANILGTSGKSKKICTVHSALSASDNWKEKYVVVSLNRIIYRFADTIACVSKGVESDLKSYLKSDHERIITLYNGFDLTKLRELGDEEPDSADNDLLSGDAIISTVGRVCRDKAQWHLVRAMTAVVKSYPHAKLVIVGEGPYTDYIERLSKGMGLENNVFLTGFKTNPYVYIKHSKAVVLTSLMEGLPTVLIEALALGVPCISTDFTAGAREILAPEIGSESVKLEEPIYKGAYGMITKLCDGVEYSAADPLSYEEELLAKAILMLSLIHI